MPNTSWSCVAESDGMSITPPWTVLGKIFIKEMLLVIIYMAQNAFAQKNCSLINVNMYIQDYLKLIWIVKISNSYSKYQ